MRIAAVADESLEDQKHALLERARSKYGWLPATIRVMAQGSSAAQLYLAAGDLNSRGSLSAVERELLAVVVAARNGCEYCLTAHCIAARALGLSEVEVLEARHGRSRNLRTAAILRFASTLLRVAGACTDRELEAAKAAGISDTTLIDIVGVVIENCLGNFVNNLAQTQLDDVLSRAASKLLPGLTLATSERIGSGALVEDGSMPCMGTVKGATI